MQGNSNGNGNRSAQSAALGSWQVCGWQPLWLRRHGEPRRERSDHRGEVAAAPERVSREAAQRQRESRAILRGSLSRARGAICAPEREAGALSCAPALSRAALSCAARCRAAQRCR